MHRRNITPIKKKPKKAKIKYLLSNENRCEGSNSSLICCVGSIFSTFTSLDMIEGREGGKQMLKGQKRNKKCL